MEFPNGAVRALLAADGEVAAGSLIPVEASVTTNVGEVKYSEGEAAQTAHVDFLLFFFQSSGGWIKIILPRFHVSDTCRVSIYNPRSRCNTWFKRIAPYFCPP